MIVVEVDGASHKSSEWTNGAGESVGTISVANPCALLTHGGASPHKMLIRNHVLIVESGWWRPDVICEEGHWIMGHWNT